ncbi:hypothetical protein H8E88_22290 [candidate division KSB1 bacterium]|nr:hypothetical protein [candidate division KSB1 bacterium]
MTKTKVDENFQKNASLNQTNNLIINSMDIKKNNFEPTLLDKILIGEILYDNIKY